MRIAVRVTATNTQAVATTAASAVTDVLTGRALTNSAAPAITGTAMVKNVLTASEGTWSVPLTKTGYQWKRCAADGSACVAIAGATAKTYTPVVADTGKTLVVAVAATSPADRDRRVRRVRRDRRAAPALRRDRAHHHRHAHAPAGAQGRPGHLEQLPVDVRLPVEALRLGWRQLRRHREREGGHVHAREGR